MKLLKDLFSQSSNISMVRVMSLIVVLVACYLSIAKGPEELGVISVLLAAGFTGKVVQKSIEK